MPILKDFKTIPEVFQYLTTDFARASDRTILKYKEGDKYADIPLSKFKEETESFAMGLASLGIKRDDKLAIIAENRPEWVYADFAILSLGGIDVPLYPIVTSETIEFILNNSESTAIIVSNQYQLNKVLKIRDKCKHLKYTIVMNEIDVSGYSNTFTFRNIQQKGKAFRHGHSNYVNDCTQLCKPDDLCTIIYTSGTTGEPKGVMLTHNNILSNVKAAHQVFQIDHNDTFLSFLPLCHIFERMAGYYTALAGGSIIAYAESIEKVSQNLIEVQPTIMTAVPRLFERMYSKIKKNVESQSEKKQKIFNWAIEIGRQFAEKKKSNNPMPITLTLKHKLADKLVYKTLREKTGGRMRFFISGGAALARELGQFFESAGILVIEGYGLTESSPVIAANRVNDYKFGTVGKTLPGVEVKIASDGEILAYGPNIMQGYYKNKKETEATVKDGWLYTGDIGVFDAEGFLIITDRKKSLFKTSGGKYIAPTPIENMFLSSKFIDQFVLIGDKRMFLTALIVPDIEAVKEYADAHRINYNNADELLNMKQIYDLLEKEMGQIQKNLANYERVRKFALLDKPFSIETGEMTPSLKIKRKVVEERYQNLIEDMYKGLAD